MCAKRWYSRGRNLTNHFPKISTPITTFLLTSTRAQTEDKVGKAPALRCENKGLRGNSYGSYDKLTKKAQ